MSRGRLALASGLVTLALVAVGVLLARQPGSPLHPVAGGTGDQGPARGFLLVLAAAFTAYAAGVVLLRHATVGLRGVLAIAVATQLAPLAAPLLLSTDAWTYWAYGAVANEGGNPYVDPPASMPDNPALPWMGAAWVDTTTVYGPLFTMVSQPLARMAGDSEVVAGWQYKSIAAAAAVAATLLAARHARRRALAAAFVGWNPVLAVHLAGGGHNDAWIGALVVGALALDAAGRRQLPGVLWVAAIAVKWLPLVFLGLRALEARATRRAVGLAGFAAAAAFVLVAATAAYGLAWLEAFRPLAENLRLETSYGVPHRLEQAGVPDGVAGVLAVAILLAGLALLARKALHGRALLGSAAVLLLVTTPWLTVWYLGWAVPVAAADENDRWGRVGCLALTAYLLPQGIPT